MFIENTLSSFFDTIGMEGVGLMWYEWLGYAASLIVLVSLVMSSVKRLRWINLAGSLVFAAYGILIESYPVAIMNFGIVLVNTYYLYNIYHQKDALKVVPIQSDVAYLEIFVNQYLNDMKKFMATDTEVLYQKDYTKFFVTRNTVPAGLFVGKKNNDQLDVLIDYTTPAYRDFKIGNFIYETNKNKFEEMGIKKLVSEKGTPKHQSYLERMGFVLNKETDMMEKSL